ncbi:YeeE/YedE family protein [Burkholderiaceae bacterium DAT-1]|nr:YeeE/YedE family protein [Burkholderiaceae bacterium DAT-1]
MKRLLFALLSGVIFGAGLALSGMTDPARVLGFLNLRGHWDPSLLFVLGGAVGVTLFTFRLILRRPAPLTDSRFHLPTQTRIDRPLIVGAAVFGVGWGLSGYCPGPAFAQLANPGVEALYFLPAMLVGIWLGSRLRRGR